MTTLTASGSRAGIRAHALRLEYLSIGWNLVEGVIAVAAALAAGSVALLGFGIDSFVETASAAVLVWRLRAESGALDPVAMAALAMTAFLVREGREAWGGQDCGCLGA